MQVSLKEWAVAGALLLGLGLLLQACAVAEGTPSTTQTATSVAENSALAGKSDNTNYSAFLKAFPRGDVPEDLREPQFSIDLALQALAENHIASHPPAELVQAGFARLQETDPTLSFTTSHSEGHVAYKGKEVYRFALPADLFFPYPSWAEAVAKSLEAYLAARPAEAGVGRNVLAERFLAGIADSLNDATAYVPRATARMIWRGETGKVDIDLEPTAEGALVAAISDFDLLDQRLIRRGDLITAIDGSPIVGLDRYALEALLVGPVGSRLTLTVRRQDSQSANTLTFERRRIDASYVRTSRVGTLLVIEMRRFVGNTDAALHVELAEAFDDSQDAPTGMIIDLRGSQGGPLEAIRKVAQIFAKEREVFSTHGRHRDSHQTFRATILDRTGGLPLVILIDEGTAGGGEIVASALQDTGRAIAVGRTSKGLGTVRKGQSLTNSAYLFVAWAQVHTAGGYRLDKRGVLPTICTGGEVTAEAVLAGLRAGRGVIDRATRTRDIDPADTAAVAAFRALCRPREDDTNVALEVARALLADPLLYAAVLAASDDQKSAAR